MARRPPGREPVCRRHLGRLGAVIAKARVQSSPGWTRTNNPSVNSRMLCQLSYRGLTTTRLRRLAVSSAYVVLRFDFAHCLINSRPNAISLPAQSSGERAVPDNRAATAEIPTGCNDHSPLSS